MSTLLVLNRSLATSIFCSHYDTTSSADVAQMVERNHGKVEVTGSIPVIGFDELTAVISGFFIYGDRKLTYAVL